MANRKKFKALSDYLDCGLSDIVDLGDGEFDVDGVTYLVLTSSEAFDELRNLVRDYVDDESFRDMYGVGIDDEVFEDKCYEICETLVDQMSQSEFAQNLIDFNIVEPEEAKNLSHNDYDEIEEIATLEDLLIRAMVDQIDQDYNGNFLEWYEEETGKSISDLLLSGEFGVSLDDFVETLDYDLIANGSRYEYMPEYDMYIFER